MLLIQLTAVLHFTWGTPAAHAAAGALTLHPPFSAPVGAEQAYLFTGRLWNLGEEYPAELPPRREAGVEQDALYVRYRVLEPGPDGSPRLEVLAHSLEGATLRPFALLPWRGILRLTPEGAVPEVGEIPSWGAVQMESPEWVTGWVTPAAELPQGAVPPGTSWQVRVPVVVGLPDGFRVNEAALEISGTFSGWPERDGRTVAVVSESFAGRASGLYEIFSLPPDCDAACMAEMAEWIVPFSTTVAGDAEMWLVPGEFPWGGRSGQRFDIEWSEPDAQPARAYAEVQVQRHDEPQALAEGVALANGETRHGDLGTGALLRHWSRGGRGAPADLYTFAGEAGDRALIIMNASGFEPLLILSNEEGQVIAEADTWFGPAPEIWVTLPYTGTYAVQATTSADAAAGSYTLSLATGPDAGEAFPPGDPWSGDPFDSEEDGAGPEQFWDWGWLGGIGTNYAECEVLTKGTLRPLALSAGMPRSDMLRAGTRIDDCDELPTLYRFQGTQDTEILIQMISDQFDTYLVLLDSEWNVLETDDDSAGDVHAQIRTWLPADGDYYVLAGESLQYSHGGGGEYTLYFDSGDQVVAILEGCGYPRTRTPVALDAPALAGSIAGYLDQWVTPVGCSATFDLYTFTGAAGDEVEIEARSADFDTTLTLLDEAMNELAFDDDGAGGKDAAIAVTLPATGVYYVKVQSFWPYTGGSYELSLAHTRLAPRDTPPDAAVDACAGLWERGALALRSGDWDEVLPGTRPPFAAGACYSNHQVYRFEASEGDEALIEVYTDEPARIQLTVFDTAWQVVADDTVEASDFGQIYTLIPESGTYFIVSGAFNDAGETVPYDLYLDVGFDLFANCWSPEEFVLEPGVPVTVERDLFDLPGYCNGLSDRYTFFGEAGAAVTIRMTSDQFYSYLGLFDPDLYFVVGDDELERPVTGGEPPGAQISIVLPVTGEYFIEANMVPAGAGYIGTYTLQLDVHGFVEETDSD